MAGSGQGAGGFRVKSIRKEMSAKSLEGPRCGAGGGGASNLNGAGKRSNPGRESPRQHQDH